MCHRRRRRRCRDVERLSHAVIVVCVVRRAERCRLRGRVCTANHEAGELDLRPAPSRRPCLDMNLLMRHHGTRDAGYCLSNSNQTRYETELTCYCFVSVVP